MNRLLGSVSLVVAVLVITGAIMAVLEKREPRRARRGKEGLYPLPMPPMPKIHGPQPPNREHEMA